jgi:hypothetical protein
MSQKLLRVFQSARENSKPSTSRHQTTIKLLHIIDRYLKAVITYNTFSVNVPTDRLTFFRIDDESTEPFNLYQVKSPPFLLPSSSFFFSFYSIFYHLSFPFVRIEIDLEMNVLEGKNLMQISIDVHSISERRTQRQFLSSHYL